MDELTSDTFSGRSTVPDKVDNSEGVIQRPGGGASVESVHDMCLAFNQRQMGLKASGHVCKPSAQP